MFSELHVNTGEWVKCSSVVQCPPLSLQTGSAVEQQSYDTNDKLFIYSSKSIKIQAKKCLHAALGRKGGKANLRKDQLKK